MRQLAIVIAMVGAVGGGVWMAAAQAPAPSPAQKIGVVDPRVVMSRSSVGIAFRDQTERIRAAAQKELEPKVIEFQKLLDEANKKAPLMTAEARGEQQEQLAKKELDLKRLREDLNRELERKVQILQGRAEQEVKNFIARVGKERGYHLLINSQLALYGAPEADVTDEIIRAYDKEVLTKGQKK